MLKIDPKFIQQANAAVTPEDLWPVLQNAVMLEHSTIPPYLTALFSIKPGTNQAIADIIHSIVVEEMLHMTIACNILNALGGSPNINTPGFVPAYPGHLPLGIGGSLVVGLEKLSLDVVKNVFMEIEEPEDPIVFKSLELSAAAPPATIGAFYEAVQQAIGRLPDENLPGDLRKQVSSSFFSAEDLYPITTKTQAISAINVIIEQGEGTSTSPLDPEGELAHYYKFEEIYKGKALVADPKALNGYSFSGPAIPLDADNVFNIFPNTKSAMLQPGTEGSRRMDEFNGSYVGLLNALHRTFNGEPDYLQQTFGLMYDVKLRGQRLCAMPFPGKSGYNIGPSFEYISQDLSVSA